MKRKIIVIASICAGITATIFGFLFFGGDSRPVTAMPPPLSPLSEIICASLSQQECYEEYYKTLTNEQGGIYALLEMEERYKTDDYVKLQCHPLTHVVGRTAARNLSVGTAFAEGTSFCWSGFYHGAMETIISHIGKQNLAEKLDSICKEVDNRRGIVDRLKGENIFDYYNCVHGLGHGIMAVYYNDLFASLEVCNGLTGRWEKKSCWGGIFMENIIAEGLGEKTPYLKPDEPLYPCTAVDEQYKTECYSMQTSYMLKTAGYDFKKVFGLCRGVEDAHRNTCFLSLGRDVSGNTVSDIGKSIELCLLGKGSNEQYYCLLGAAKDFVSYFHSDEKALTLCGAAPEEFREDCRKEIETFYRIY